MPDSAALTPADLRYLRRCVELAREALEDDDEPFGALLVDAHGSILFEDRNRVKGGNHTRHPEFEIARWAAAHLTPEQRATATVYTSGEHCPMCAAAHGWVGLGDIVYASSSEQLVTWYSEWDQPAAPVAALPVAAVVPGATTRGPSPELAGEVRALHARMLGRTD